MELRKHAYITARGFEYREAGRWKVEDFEASTFANADALLARLYSANRAIWILSEGAARELRRPLDMPSSRFEVKRNDKDAAHLEMSERISFKPQGAQDRDGAQIFFPTKAEAWGFHKGNAETIERAISRLQEYFRRSFVYRPGLLNAFLMEGAREKAGAQVNYKRKPSGFELFTVPRLQYLDWSRLRPFTEEEKRARYIHSFDKVGMYLQATGMPLGVGNYRHIVKPEIVNAPGMWRVESVPLSDNQLWNVPGAQNEWVCTPALLLLRDLGLLREIHEAYITDESHKLFPTYYSHMRQALKLAASEGGEVGETMKDCVKTMYTRGIGYLNSKEHFEDEWFYRPDWWATIVSEAGARVFRDALTVRDTCAGAIPVATHVDCLYYVSNEANAFDALPAFASTLANKFRHKGTCQLTPEMIEAFNSGIGSGGFAGLVKKGVKVAKKREGE